MMEAPPLLVQVLGGNVVTMVLVLACLNTADATALRRLHPALAVAVAAVPWADTTAPVHNIERWRAALPAATALKLTARAVLPQGRELVALRGVTELDLTGCDSVTDAVIARLPPTLRALRVSHCWIITHQVSFTRLSVLEVLDCSSTIAVEAGLARLPPSLRELRMHGCALPATADFSHLRQLQVMYSGELCGASASSLPPSLEVLDFGSKARTYRHAWPRDWSAAHLTRLRVLKAPCMLNIDAAAIAALPPSLQVLDLEDCNTLPFAVFSFAHLTSLRTLNLRDTLISSATLATLPPSLASLDLSMHHQHHLRGNTGVFPDLPALRVLNVNRAGVGDAAIASMPAGLEELSMVCCRNVTQAASLDHLAALRVLQSAGTDLSPVTIETCRTRGCFAPATGKLVPNHRRNVNMVMPLPDGRLVSGAFGGYVTLWEATAQHDAVVAEVEVVHFYVTALAVLHDSYRVAIGMSGRDDAVTAGIAFWDTKGALEPPPYEQVINRAAVACDSNVAALAVAHNGHLVAGCNDGRLRVIDVDVRAVVATLAAHASKVTAVAMLLDGRVASASWSGELKLWNVGTWVCVSTLVGHTTIITSLAVLSDGRLASGSCDNTMRLWDIGGTGTCVRVVTGVKNGVSGLAALPGDQLASVSVNGEIRVWDMRGDVGGASGALARPLLIVAPGRVHALVSLPGNRLVTGGEGGVLPSEGVHLWQLPPPRSV